MAKQDYYELLGISRSADEKEIKRAYKKLAMQYHPDRTKGDKEKEEKFKEIQEAYEVLNEKNALPMINMGTRRLNKELALVAAVLAVRISGIFSAICSEIFSVVADVGANALCVVTICGTTLKLRWKKL